MQIKGGKFIVFEGLDGSGHSTQTELIFEHLRNDKIDIAFCREPTDNFIGKEIRRLLRDDNKHEFTPLEKQQLFVADRVIHTRTKVISFLESNVNIVCDRYYFSTLAYGFSDGLDSNFLLEYNKHFPIPDTVIFLKVAPEICMERIKKRGKPIEHFEKLEILKRVNDGYRQAFDCYQRWTGKEVFIVNGENSEEKVFENVKNIIDRIFQQD